MPTLEMFSKKISTSTWFSVEIAGLRKKKIDDKKFIKSLVSLLLCGVLEVHTILLAICIARYQFVSNFW